MAVHNDIDLVQITCDGFRCTETIEAYNFDDARDHMQRDLWSYYTKPDGKWVHFCRGCKPKVTKPDKKAIFG